jgi:hypothetical protein
MTITRIGAIQAIQTKRRKPTASPRRTIMGAGKINNLLKKIYWKDPHPLCALSVELWVIQNRNTRRKEDQRMKPTH